MDNILVIDENNKKCPLHVVQHIHHHQSYVKNAFRDVTKKHKSCAIMLANEIKVNCIYYSISLWALFCYTFGFLLISYGVFFFSLYLAHFHCFYLLSMWIIELHAKSIFCCIRRVPSILKILLSLKKLHVHFEKIKEALRVNTTT